MQLGKNLPGPTPKLLPPCFGQLLYVQRFPTPLRVETRLFWSGVMTRTYGIVWVVFTLAKYQRTNVAQVQFSLEACKSRFFRKKTFLSDMQITGKKTTTTKQKSE